MESIATLLNPYVSGRGGGGGGGGGGRAQRPDDQIHSCHSEISYPMIPKLSDFLVFVFKTCFDQILAKLVAAALFSSRRLKNVENE